MRLLFAGTPDTAVPSLDALLDSRHDVVAVLTRADAPSGRGRRLTPSPVRVRAEEAGIPVITDRPRGEDFLARLAELDVDAAPVVAYGEILRPDVLAVPRHGWVNLHFSVLPAWRGAAPVQRAIIAGDLVTGVTIMGMEAGLDTGPMLLRRELAIGRKNAGQLTDELAQMGAEMMTEVLADLPAFPPEPQPDEGVTHAPKIRKEEARIDWSLFAGELARLVQGLAPFPGAWFEVDGERIKLLEAVAGDDARGHAGEVFDESLGIACGKGHLRPLLVQRAGRGPMTPDELLRGFPIPKGTRLA